MKIHQKYTDSELRNFTYIIELDNGNAIVVDPWNDTLVNKFLDQYQLTLMAIINTHEHWDHVQGNSQLVAQHQCQVWAHQIGRGKIPEQTHFLVPNEKITLQDNTIMEVIDTPGHSQAHMCFIIHYNNRPHSIFTGDILFNAGVGRCNFGGNVDDMYETIKNKIASLPDDILVLPGHEYLENNLKFTLDREPANKAAKDWLQKFYQADVYNNPLVTTIADEYKINTFLRLDSPDVIENLPQPTSNDKDVFVALRSLRDKW
jgi:hydroxyacylglutathione hydrolase